MTIPNNFLSAIATAGANQTTIWDRLLAFISANTVLFWSIVAAVAVIIIALIIFLGVRSKRKNQEQPADVPQEPVTFLR